MRKQYDLGALEWSLAGWTPYVWRQQRSIESGVSLNAEIPSVPARVPGSVQGALLEASLLPDWNVGLNARLCEWVENRHWIYTAHIPDSWLQSIGDIREKGWIVRLRALGLDSRGWILVNGKEVARFDNAFVPLVVDLTSHVGRHGNVLQIVFDSPGRWLGQVGHTSRMTEWKPRFNYFWDWTSRLVQIGIWDCLTMEVCNGRELLPFHCSAGVEPTSGRGRVTVEVGVPVSMDARVRVTVDGTSGPILDEELPVSRLLAGETWEDLDVELWWPNGAGPQHLYTLTCTLVSAEGTEEDRVRRRLGFRSLEWTQNEDAPPGADPWLCLVNDTPIFLQGVNWTPIRPNFADVRDEQYRQRLELYGHLGCNMLRVWGGSFLEKQVFYDLCDELGLLVWQEFPLSSSGLENLPPDDPVAIEEMAAIASSYIHRRGHHASLAVWCGGNELQDRGVPVHTGYPMITRLAAVVATADPDRRFLPTSPSGPSFGSEEERFGQGVHWDVHGPWHVKGDLETDWSRFWRQNDALFFSEVGVSSASPVSIIRAFKGDLPELPGTRENELWRRTSWWIEWPVFVQELGREPDTLEEFVAWSQERQRQALSIAAAASKSRFPACGGILVWMGHDSFPCTANTAIVDFNGNPKPAALALGEIFRAPPQREEHSI